PDSQSDYEDQDQQVPRPNNTSEPRLDGGDPGKAIDAAKLVGLHDAIMRLPQGYETDIGEGGNLLLRAQRKQLGLARAAYGNPSLIV
ncbi:hypothetical protein ACC797_38325, partial [Rhizobium ruizarguesonis]